MDSGSIGERKLSMGRMSDEARRCRNEKNKERMHKSFPKWENNLKIGRGCVMGKPEPGACLGDAFIF